MRFQIPQSGIVVAGLSDTLDLIRESFHSPLMDAALPNHSAKFSINEKIKFVRHFFALLIILNLSILGFLLWIFLGGDSGNKKNLLASASIHAELFPCTGLEIGADGGYVFSPDGAAIFVPKYALASSQCISIRRMSSGDATDVYRVGPDGISFQAPVTLIIPYRSLKIARMTIERSGRLFEIPYEIHAPTHTLRARVDHF